jgi:hypothetical protein
MDTQLVRFGTRDYDAAAGRWMASDPVRFLGGQPNLYSYINGDPINATDKTGLFGFGTTAGYEVSTGIGMGVVLSASSGAVQVFNGWSPSGTAVYTSSAFAGSPYPSEEPISCGPDPVYYPIQDPIMTKGWAMGVYAGVGWGAFVTSASSLADFGGPSSNLTLNLPLISIQLSASASAVTFGFTVGPSFGADISYFESNTRVAR